MKQLVIVHPEPPTGYKAQAVAFPQISGVAESEEQAIEQVRQKLSTWLSSARLVSVEIPAPDSVNPLAALAGLAKDDPDFDLYLEEIERYRQDFGRVPGLRLDDWTV